MPRTPTFAGESELVRRVHITHPELGVLAAVGLPGAAAQAMPSMMESSF